MKKILAIAILLSSLFALASCKDVQESAQTTTEQTTQATTEPQNVAKEYYSNGNLKTLTVFDDNGNVVSVAKYNNLGYCTEEYLFDSKGREKLITTYENFNQNGIALTQSIYDPIKATTVVKNYSKDGAYIERVTSYNENYLPVKDEYFDAESNVLKYELYDYHDNLNVKSIFYYKGNEKDAYVIYDENGVLLSSKESGKPAKIFFYNLNGELEEVKEHIYSIGEIAQINKYSESGNLLYRLDYEIKEYDALLQSRTDFNEDGNGFIKTVYEYNKDGSLSKALSHNEKDLLVKEEEFLKNASSFKDIYHYNEKDLLIKEEHYIKNELSYYYLFEHYENGNVSKLSYYFRHKYIDSVYTNKILLEYCIEFHENGNYAKETYYNYEGIIACVREYAENGDFITETRYDANGNIISIKSNLATVPT